MAVVEVEYASAALGLATPVKGRAHLVRASCSLSNVFCLLSSSINVTVTSFSRSFDSVVAIGGVTPK